MVLLNQALVVEARTLMRCCWENAFYFTGIARRGEEFVEEMLTGDLTTRRTIGERLLKQKRGAEGEDHLRKFLKTVKTEPGVVNHLDITAPADSEEVIETIDFACGALPGACYAFGETMGGSRAAPEVKARLAEMQQLQGMRV